MTTAFSGPTIEDRLPVKREPFTIIRTYQSEPIRSLTQQDQFDLSFVADAQKRVLYSISPSESSHPGRISYIPLGKTRQQLQPIDIERVLTDIIKGYFHEPEISSREVRQLNFDLYQRWQRELLIPTGNGT